MIPSQFILEDFFCHLVEAKKSCHYQVMQIPNRTLYHPPMTVIPLLIASSIALSYNASQTAHLLQINQEVIMHKHPSL